MYTFLESPETALTFGAVGRDEETEEGDVRRKRTGFLLFMAFLRHNRENRRNAANENARNSVT